MLTIIAILLLMVVIALSFIRMAIIKLNDNFVEAMTVLFKKER